MQMEELRKQWITSEKEYREGEVFVYRQKFTASQVKKAVFYGTALGVYEAELNGTKIGRQMFAPGFSYYPRRVLYQTHEVTKLLREGENTLTVYLGQRIAPACPVYPPPCTFTSTSYLSVASSAASG